MEEVRFRVPRGSLLSPNGQWKRVVVITPEAPEAAGAEKGGRPRARPKAKAAAKRDRAALFGAEQEEEAAEEAGTGRGGRGLGGGDFVRWVRGSGGRQRSTVRGGGRGGGGGKGSGSEGGGDGAR